MASYCYMLHFLKPHKYCLTSWVEREFESILLGDSVLQFLLRYWSDFSQLPQGELGLVWQGMAQAVAGGLGVCPRPSEHGSFRVPGPWLLACLSWGNQAWPGLGSYALEILPFPCSEVNHKDIFIHRRGRRNWLHPFSRQTNKKTCGHILKSPQPLSLFLWSLLITYSME